MTSDIRHWIDVTEPLVATRPTPTRQMKRPKPRHEVIEARGYHGSSEAAPVFGPTHTGQNSHTFGAYTSTRHGIFFSNNRRAAALYGQVGHYQLRVRHTLDLDNDNNVLWDFVQSLDPHDPADRPIWMDARNALYGSRSWHWFEDEVGERCVAYLKQRGFDSARFLEYIPDDHGGEVKSVTTVVFDPTRVHNIG